MRSTSLRAAVIGAGQIGSQRSEQKRLPGVLSHAEAYTSCDATDLVAIVDVNPAALDKVNRQWPGVHLYRDISSMCAKERPDIVSICTPDETHAELIRELAQFQTRAILCEKPLASSVAEAQDLTALCARNGTLLAVNYTRRYDPVHRDIADRIQRGLIGGLQHATGWYTKSVVHNGTHLIDTLRMYCGEITDARCYAARISGQGDCSADAALTFSNGATAFIHGCDSSRFAIFEIDLLGDSGRVKLTDEGHATELWTVGESLYYPGYRQLHRTDEVFPVGLRNALLHAVADTADALMNGRSPACTAADAIRALEVAEQLQMQAECLSRATTGWS